MKSKRDARICAMPPEEFDDILRRVNRDAPKWRQRSGAIEKSGRLPQDLLEWIYELGLFKLMLPREFGGKPVSFPQALRLFDELSGIDGSLGWSVHIGAAGGYFAPSFAKATAQALYSPREAVIAGSGTPSGRARKVPGGYAVTGTWRFASGAQYASLFTAAAVCEEDGATRAFAFSPGQVRVTHDWRAFGLKGTSTDTIEVEDAFVPGERVFVAGSHVWNVTDPVAAALYRLPFDVFAAMAIASVSVGLVRRFFALARETERWERLRDKQQHAARAAALRERFYTAADYVWSKIAVGDELTEAERQEIVGEVRHIVDESVNGVQATFPYLGMGALWESEPVNRVYRDLMTASHHKFLRPVSA